MTSLPETPSRLNKYLALQMGISRRQADQLIDQGKVLVDGRTATLGDRYINGANILVNNSKIAGKASFVYLALHKPTGYVCSRKRQGKTPTVYELLPIEYRTLKSVGRLDKDSSGLLLMTNDGNFTHQMTHPSHYKTKIYTVQLGHDLEPLHQQMISDHGIMLEDGPSRMLLERASQANRHSWIVTMHQGRNRQIRRTFAALGYKVIKLHRTNFGPYALGDIPTGQFTIVNRK